VVGLSGKLKIFFPFSLPMGSVLKFYKTLYTKKLIGKCNTGANFGIPTKIK
jgi:hypothetical protein